MAAWSRWALFVVVGAAVGSAGCGDSASPAERLIQNQNDLARERCDCFYMEEGYTSAAECREAETIPFAETNECEERAYGADETGVVRESTECLADVRGEQAGCYRQAGCDPDAFQSCDSEALAAVSECPQPTEEAMQAFNQELQACLSGGTAPMIDVCPDGDAGSAVGTPAITGSTDSSDNDLGGSCGGSGSVDEALEWVAPESGTVTIDTFGTDFDTVLYVLEGSCTGTELACNDDASGAPGFQSQVTLDVTQGETLILVVDAWAGEQGPFQLNIQY